MYGKSLMRLMLPMLALASAAAVVGAPAGADLPSPPPGSGASLDDQVRHELRMLPYYGIFDDLTFHVDGGTVTLAGEVTQPVVRIDAGNSVKQLPGVTTVDNRIEVLPLSSFDWKIRRQTAAAIYGYSPLQRYGQGTLPPIHIIVKDGHVTLKGIVDSDTDRNMAYIRANQVRGVFSVTNELTVNKHP